MILSRWIGATQRSVVVVAGVAALASCDKGAGTKATPAASVQHAVPESELATVRLTAEADRRLRIATAVVSMRRVGAVRSLGGDVIVAPGHGQTLIAPAAGIVAVNEGGLPVTGARVRAGQTLLRLLALPAGGELLRTNEEVRAAEARARQATLEAQRAEQLFADRLISARERERAAADLEVARAALDAARSRAGLAGGEKGAGASASSFVVTAPEDGVISALHVGPGQTVAAGTPMIEIVRTDRLWVRVPVYVGDLSRVDQRASVIVRGLGDASGAGVVATAQPSPPVADPSSASADLYYALPSGSSAFRPGARVQVAVPLRGESGDVPAVPYAAVVYDYQGGAWVYERVAPLTYARRRVALGAIAGGWAELKAGPPVGATIVTDGAAELFGTEFGAGK